MHARALSAASGICAMPLPRSNLLAAAALTAAAAAAAASAQGSSETHQSRSEPLEDFRLKALTPLDGRLVGLFDYYAPTTDQTEVDASSPNKPAPLFRLVRYGSRVAELGEYFSEYALIKVLNMLEIIHSLPPMLGNLSFAILSSFLFSEPRLFFLKLPFLLF